MKAEIYTKSDCSFCQRAKSLMNEQGIAYDEFIVSAGINEAVPAANQRYVTKSDLLERVPTAKTVPQIWLDGNYIGGYTELAAFMSSAAG